MVHASVSPCGVDHESFCTAVAAAEAAGHDVTALDLRAEGFAAVMSAAEHLAYESDDPIISDDVRRHAELVRQAEALVFVYPTTITTVPALLKGWFERVLVQGVAFVLDEHTRRVRPGLLHVRWIVGIVTDDGAPSRFGRSADNGRRVVLRTLRLNTGLRTRTAWISLHRVGATSMAGRQRFLARVERRMARL